MSLPSLSIYVSCMNNVGTRLSNISTPLCMFSYWHSSLRVTHSLCLAMYSATYCLESSGSVVLLICALMFFLGGKGKMKKKRKEVEVKVEVEVEEGKQAEEGKEAAEDGKKRRRGKENVALAPKGINVAGKKAQHKQLKHTQFGLADKSSVQGKAGDTCTNRGCRPQSRSTTLASATTLKPAGRCASNPGASARTASTEASQSMS